MRVRTQTVACLLSMPFLALVIVVSPLQYGVASPTRAVDQLEPPLITDQRGPSVSTESKRATSDSHIRIAKKKKKKKTFKYEIPKAQRAAPTPQAAPAARAAPRKKAPTVVAPSSPRKSVKRSGSSGKTKYRRSKKRSKSSGSSGVSHYGGNCQTCRNSCYVRWRVNCGQSRACTNKFVPCMRSCWKRLCR